MQKLWKDHITTKKEKKMENQNSQEKQKNYWTKSEAEKIIQILSVLINGQKTYGKEYSVKDTFAYYRLKLESKFSADQVIYGMDKYTDTKNDIPAPSDIINILNPEAPRITEAQYVNACKAQERNGFPAFTAESVIIEDYRKQNSEDQEDFKIQNEAIAGLVRNSITKM